MPCPCQIPVPDYPDNAEWGPIFWRLLHGLAEVSQRASLPMDELREWKKFLELIGETLPCDFCRRHYNVYMKQHPFPFLASKSSNSTPYNQLNTWLKTFFLNLHNEVNVSNNKPVFEYADLTSAYSHVNVQDCIWQLDPVMKKVVVLNGVTVMKWNRFVHCTRMLKSIIGI